METSLPSSPASAEDMCVVCQGGDPTQVGQRTTWVGNSLPFMATGPASSLVDAGQSPARGSEAEQSETRPKGPQPDSPDGRRAKRGAREPRVVPHYVDTRQGSLLPLGRRKGSAYAYCFQCGSVQLVPLPTKEKLARLYREEYHESGHYHLAAEANEKQRRHLNSRIASLIASLHPSTDRRLVVELGTGWGSLGLEIIGRGLSYLGLEPSTTMCQAAKERGLDVRQGSLETLESDSALQGRVRTFVTLSVYEHLVDQTDALRRMAAVLPPEGRIVIQCPTASVPRIVGRWQRRLAPRRELPSLLGIFAPPWHVCMPSIQGVRLQAARTGLVVERVLASPSGRNSRLSVRLAQILQETVARSGHRLFGEGWPISACHIFVLRHAG